MGKYFVGTEIKLSYKITQDGFDMGTDPWTATVRCGENSLTCDRTHNAVYSAEDECWYLLIDSSKLGSGKYELVTDIDVPDTDFDDGYRHQTYKNTLFNFEWA